MIIANEQLREKFVAHFDAAAIYYLNILSYKACEIAYTKCDQWLEELLGVIRENRDYVAGISGQAPSAGQGDTDRGHLPAVDGFPGTGHG